MSISREQHNFSKKEMNGRIYITRQVKRLDELNILWLSDLLGFQKGAEMRENHLRINMVSVMKYANVVMQNRTRRQRTTPMVC